MQEAARRRHAQNILQPRTQKQSRQLGRGCHTIARQRRRPAKNSSAACNRLPSSGARCLPANYGERALKCQGKVTIVTEIAKNRKRKHRKDIVYIHKKLSALKKRCVKKIIGKKMRYKRAIIKLETEDTIQFLDMFYYEKSTKVPYDLDILGT